MSEPATWVLLRGLMREARHWGAFPQAFAEMLGVRVVLIDLPGNGERHADTSPDTIEGMAEAAREELHRLGLREPWNLLAMSMGAMVAVAWAQRHPQDIERAVLVNTSLRPFSPFYRRLQPRAYAGFARLALGKPSAHEIERGILKLTTTTRPEAVIDDWVAWRREHPVSRGNALRQLAAAVRYRAPRQAPLEKLLLLNGAGDALVHPSCSERLATRWNRELITHPSAGHDLPLDDGEWVIETVRRWAGVRAAHK
jgi:pimeloyl-ACP methyl ester carboxylesterase